MSDGEPYDDGDPPPTDISSYDNIIQKAQGLWAKGDVIYTVGIDTQSITTAPAESILKAMAGGNGPGGITGGYTAVEKKADFDVLVNNLVNKLTC
jgi:hypothetical protein